MSSLSQRTGTPPACLLFVFRTCLGACLPRPQVQVHSVSPVRVSWSVGSECREEEGVCVGGGGDQESCPVEVLVLTMRGT